tara:strand:- start:242 stop:499 length:258 start_codon:yes stop_codon:yes gene_type:complete
MSRKIIFILGEILYTLGEYFDLIYIFRQELKTALERRKAIHKEVKPPRLTRGKSDKVKTGERKNSATYCKNIDNLKSHFIYGRLL